MNKKIFFLFIVASFLFLSPLTVKADSIGYRSSWTSWSATSGGNALSEIQNYQYRGGTYTGTSQGLGTWQEMLFYPSINNTVTVGQHDYMILNYMVIATNDDLFTQYYSYSDGTLSQSSSDVSTLSFNIVVRWHRDGITGNYDIPCYPLGNIGGSTSQGSVYCPMPDIASSWDYVKFRYFVPQMVGQLTFDIYFALDHTYLYHYVGQSTSGIESAINDSTSAIEDVNDSINDMNSSINDNTSTSAENQGSSLFGNFNAPSNPLTSIVTLPLQLLSAATDTCQPVGLWFNWSVSGLNVPDKAVYLPCGTTLFWENPDLMGGSGNKLVNFRNFWNFLIGGPIIYGLLVLIYKEVNAALDPLSDSVITYDKVSKSNEEKKAEDKDGDNSG